MAKSATAMMPSSELQAEDPVEYVITPKQYLKFRRKLTHGRLDMLILDEILLQTYGKPPDRISKKRPKWMLGTLAQFAKLDGDDDQKGSQSTTKKVIDWLVHYRIILQKTAAEMAALGQKSPNSRSLWYALNWTEWAELKRPDKSPFAGTWEDEAVSNDAEEPEEETAEKPARKVISIGKQRVAGKRKARYHFEEPLLCNDIDVSVDSNDNSEHDVDLQRDGNRVSVHLSRIQQDAKSRITVDSNSRNGLEKRTEGESKVQEIPRAEPEDPGIPTAEQFIDLFHKHHKPLSPKDIKDGSAAFRALTTADRTACYAWAMRQFISTRRNEQYTPTPLSAIRSRGWERKTAESQSSTLSLRQQMRAEGKL